MLCCSVLLAGCQTTSNNRAAIDPAAQEPEHASYLIGPEDVLEVNVWKNPDLSQTVAVRPDGKITLPLIGEVMAGGRTATAVREEIRSKLEKFYREVPEVTVTVSEVNSLYIYVLGEVRAPGRYQIKSYTTVLQAIALAGGFSQWADRNDMVILRKNGDGTESRIRLRYKDILRKQGVDQMLQRGDTLIVP